MPREESFMILIGNASGVGGMSISTAVLLALGNVYSYGSQEPYAPDRG